MKMRSILIPSNVHKTIMLSDYAADDQSFELFIGAGSQIVCVDDRAWGHDTIHASLIITTHKNAQLTYCDQRKFLDQAQVINDITLIAERDSFISFEQWQRGGQKVKTTIDAQLCGEGAEITMRLGARLSGNQKNEISTRQQHKAAYTKSHCVVKMIIADTARSLYDGMISVAPSARQTEAFQDHKALLMSDSAYAFAQPSLQVETDDVQCGHGSAIGQLDAEQVGYLHARGIDPVRAQELLLHAFMNDLYSSESLKKAPHSLVG